MDMTKKSIVQILAKSVYDKIGSAASYGHTRKRLIEVQGVSEIALYSAVADHLEENDIDPKKYVDDMYTLYIEISNNVFYIKTDDRYSYLRERLSTISMENSPESKGKFLCNRCFEVKSDSDRCGKPNYKNSCAPCFKELSRVSSKKYAQKKKEQKELEKNLPPEELVEPPEQPVTTPPVQSDTSINKTLPDGLEPFIVMETIIGDGADVTISVSCSTINLSKLLVLIDPYLMELQKTEPLKPEPEPEPQPNQEKSSDEKEEE